jgi:hypothetical protein
MAKRQSKNKPAEVIKSVNVNQTVNVGDTWDSVAFAKLLQEQSKANETAIKNLETAMASAGANQQQLQQQIAQSAMMKDIKDILLAELQDKQFKRLKEEAVKKKQQETDAIKKSNAQLKQNIQLRADEAKAIANIAKNMETFKTIGDRFTDLSKRLKDNFGSMSALKTTALKAFNIGGIFNKSIAKEKFIQTQRKLGSEDDRATLAGKFESANKTAKEIKKNEAEFAELKKETGMSESQLAGTKRGKELLSKRSELSEEYAKSDLKASLVKKDTGGGGAAQEAEIEQLKKQEKQSNLLLKIEENTRSDKPAPDARKAAAQDDKAGGGLLGKLMGGGGMGKALSSLKDFGVGIILVSGALFVAAKAFQAFAEVAWEDVGKGIVALGGLVLAAIGLDKVKGQIIAGAVSLGVLALATFGIGKALTVFQDLDWETIGKGFVSLAGIGVIGAIAGAAAPLLLLGAAGLGAMGVALLAIGEGMESVGDNMESFVQAMQKLGEIDAGNIFKLGGALASLGLGLAAFAAGNALAGMGNLVSGLLSAVTGQKSPVDQLIEIGKAGEGVEKAGNGMKSLGEGMKAFSGIKKEDLKALNEFPWEKATQFVAAGGMMSANGAIVANASKLNADEASKADAAKAGGGTAIVNAPVTNTTRQTQIIKPQIRNQESSQSRYISSRYGIV